MHRLAVRWAIIPGLISESWASVLAVPKNDHAQQPRVEHEVKIRSPKNLVPGEKVEKQCFLILTLEVRREAGRI